MKKQSKYELFKQQNALNAKYEEYSLKTTEELQEMFPILGGNYRNICMGILRKRFTDDIRSKQTEELTERDL